jgi:3-oxoacid CoA-transferase subunit A
MSQVYRDPPSATADIPSGASLAVGGFGLCGVPEALINALHDHGTTNLKIVSNNCGTDERGLGVLLAARRISRITASYVGENKEFARQYLAGELTVELCPQGTLAERLRAGGAGIPAFYTAAGTDTLIETGGLAWRYNDAGNVINASPRKETRTFGDRRYLLERAITTDYALVRAEVADTHGNLRFNKSAENFNPLAAMAARTTIVEVDRIVAPGELTPDQVDLPGIYVHRIVQVPIALSAKPVEKRTIRETS